MLFNYSTSFIRKNIMFFLEYIPNSSIIVTYIADSSRVLTNRHFVALAFDEKFKNEAMVIFGN